MATPSFRTAAQVEALVASLASFAPDVVGIENTFISVNAKTGIDLAELRGRLRQALEARGIGVQLIAPGTWRKTTIQPAAKAKRKELKRLSVAYALARYGVSATDDEADAIGIAAHLFTNVVADRSQSSLQQGEDQ
jgi:Holliday junction resolvasome RuvABC endonuclease subunit